MSFWKMAWDLGCVNEEILREIVITDTAKFGYITKDEFKLICGKDFDVVVKPAEVKTDKVETPTQPVINANTTENTGK